MQTLPVISANKRRILCVSSGGVVWETVTDGTVKLEFPGPLDPKPWSVFESLGHPQIAKVTRLGSGFERGAVVEYPSSASGRSSQIDSDSEPYLEGMSQLRSFLRLKRLDEQTEIWVLGVAPKNKETQFVCVPFSMEAVTGWFRLDLREEPAQVAPTLRLPIHRRSRFRFGALLAVSAATVAALVFAVPAQINRAQARNCPPAPVVERELAMLLDLRAAALEDADSHSLRSIESGSLLDADLERLGRLENPQSLVAPEYRVTVNQVACSGETGVVAEVLIESWMTQQDNLPRTVRSRDAKVVLGTSPWLLLDFSETGATQLSASESAEE